LLIASYCYVVLKVYLKHFKIIRYLKQADSHKNRKNKNPKLCKKFQMVLKVFSPNSTDGVERLRLRFGRMQMAVVSLCLEQGRNQLIFSGRRK